MHRAGGTRVVSTHDVYQDPFLDWQPPTRRSLDADAESRCTVVG